MERALYIFLALYFPLIATCAAVFAGDFRPQTMGSPLFRLLFVSWALDGFLCMALGIALMGRLRKGRYPRREALARAALALAAVVLGTPAAYVLVELANKLIRFLAV